MRARGPPPGVAATLPRPGGPNDPLARRRHLAAARRRLRRSRAIALRAAGGRRDALVLVREPRRSARRGRPDAGGTQGRGLEERPPRREGRPRRRGGSGRRPPDLADRPRPCRHAARLGRPDVLGRAGVAVGRGASAGLLRPAVRAPGAVRVGLLLEPGGPLLQLRGADAVPEAGSPHDHERVAGRGQPLLRRGRDGRGLAAAVDRLLPRALPAREPHDAEEGLPGPAEDRGARPVPRGQRGHPHDRVPAAAVVRGGRAEGLPRRRPRAADARRHGHRGPRGLRLGPGPASTTSTRAPR